MEKNRTPLRKWRKTEPKLKDIYFIHRFSIFFLPFFLFLLMCWNLKWRIKTLMKLTLKHSNRAISNYLTVVWHFLKTSLTFYGEKHDKKRYKKLFYFDFFCQGSFLNLHTNNKWALNGAFIFEYFELNRTFFFENNFLLFRR